MATAMVMDCSGYISRYKQRHLRSLYNVPPPRLFPPSPYPQFTERQIAMRRKVEILKYSNNTGAGTTQKSKWAQLSRTQTASQYAINNRAAEAALSCPADELIPTSTTKCDVPGPEEFLYYDPTVPLYHHATQQRAFATEPAPPYVWRPITQNVVEYVTALQIIDLVPDDPTATSYTVTCPVGVIATSNTVTVGAALTFVLNICLATWLSGVYTGDNVALTTDTPFSMAITSITYQILYNDTVITSGLASSSIPYSLVTFGPEQLPQPSGQFYGIQYVGTPTASVSIPNVQAGNIYQVVLQVTYTYPRTRNGVVNVVDRLSAFQTGIVANIDAEHTDVTTPNFEFTSTPARPFVTSNFLDYRTTFPIATLTA
jgi:hypothetical protein